jgi:putative ABC transport system ATP-binding protein
MAAELQPAFEFEQVTVDRAGRRVLDGLTARIPAAGITVVTGPSGAGKTTLLRPCNRLDVPDAGTVRYRGRALDDLDPLALRRRAGRVFQRPVPFPGTVAANLAEALPGIGAEAMTAALGRVALDPGMVDREAHTLSGGELQRMCLARTPGHQAGDAAARRADLGAGRAAEAGLRADRQGPGGRRHHHHLGHPRRRAGHPRRRPRLRTARRPPGRRRARAAGRAVTGLVSWTGLAVSLLLVAAAAGISWWQQLGLERQIVIAASRALVQLLLVGLALTLVVASGRSIWWSRLWVALMLAYAANVARRRAPTCRTCFPWRSPRSPPRRRSPWACCSACTCSR